jgi:molybdopterin converting factor small subunit
MDLIFKPSGGQNLIFRPAALPRVYPPATAQAVTVEVFIRGANEAPSANRSIGFFAPGQEASTEYTPATDTNAIFSTISYSAYGKKSVSNHEDALQATLIHQRETNAPVIAQVGQSTAEQITLVASGFTKFAHKRKVRIASVADMSDAIEQIEDAGDERLPEVFYIERTLAGGGTHASTPIVFSGNPSPGEEIIVGGKTYTYSASDNSFDNVLVGATLPATLANLRDHINRDTEAALCAAASNGADTLTLTASAVGASGNDIPLSDNSAVTTISPFAGGSGGSLSQTIYVRVSHSAGGAYGAESAAQDFTFASAGNTGGSSGDGDPFGGKKYSADDL